MILFGTTFLNGNDNNTIDNCNIYDGATTPANLIYSWGGVATNDNIVISNNNIYNFFSAASQSAGIFCYSDNSDWTIIGNSIYQTATRTFTAGNSHYGIAVWNTGNNHTISNNFIGGSAPNAGGTPWTMNGAVNSVFNSIYLNVGSVTASNVQGNTISNFDYTSSGTSNIWYGIAPTAGNINVGTISGNTIGSGTGNDAVKTTTSGSGGTTLGIYSNGGGTLNISNNTIGSITALGTSASEVTNVYAIQINTGSGTISNNTIGSTSSSNSIQNNSSSVATDNKVNAILQNSAGTWTISGNTIANLSNNNTGSGTAQTIGIKTTAGTNSISDNIIYNLACDAPNFNSDANASAIGIAQTSAVAGQTISGNTIHSLSNTSSGVGSIHIKGIHYSGAGSGTNLISKNFIHSLTTVTSSTASGNIGIEIAGGIADCANNMMRLGIKPDGSSLTVNTKIFGLLHSSTSAVNFYYNSVFIGGAGVSAGTANTYALRTSSIGACVNKNNILANVRSGGSGVNYAISLTDYTVTTCNYNVFFVNASGILGQQGATDRATLSLWKSFTSLDANSRAGAVPFLNPTGNAATVNLHIDPSIGSYVESGGAVIAGYATDFDNDARSGTAPDAGADEGAFLAPNQVHNITDNTYYMNIQDAYDFIPSPLTQAYIIEILTAYSGENSYPVILSQFAGASAANTVTIRPNVSGLSISGNSTTTILDFNGTDYVILDGRVEGAGAKDLIVTNSNTGGSTIRFINDATFNTVKYCKVQGVETSTTNGVILFSTTTGASGNDNNTIDNCDLYDGATTPANIIYSAGTAAKTNDNAVVSNNNFYNFFIANSTASGIKIASNSSDWTISGNSFYQTASRTFTVGNSQYAIYISGGNNYLVQNNFIGGTAASAGGTPWTINGAVATNFNCIYLSAGAVTASGIHGNTISNFDISTSSTGYLWYGIYIAAGNVNVGTITANTIGSGTGNDAIKTITSGSGGTTVGIASASTNTVNIANNTIGSITANGTDVTVLTNFRGIHTTAGTNNLSNNTIGSSTTSNSIQNNSSTAWGISDIYGIYNFSSGTISITGNTILNLTNNCTGTGTVNVYGIYTSAGTNTISGNLISKVYNAGPSGTIYALYFWSSNASQSVSQNTINSLYSTGASGTGIFGIYARGSATYSKNFIHSFSGGSSTGSMTGIFIFDGASDYVNNVIRIGINPDGTPATTNNTINGILLSTATANNIYYNSVYIGGSGVGAGASSTYAFRRGSTGVHQIKNNIFENVRSNGAGTGTHYAININSTTTLTSDNNLFFANGAGALFGYDGTTSRNTLSDWKTNTGLDINSFYGNAPFINPTGDAATVNMNINAATPAYIESKGTIIGGYSSDFDSDARFGDGAYAGTGTAPDIGADEGEFTIFVPNQVKNLNTGLFYETISEAYLALTTPLTQSFTIELMVTYTGEFAYPTTLAQLAGSSAANTITIRPNVAGLSISGNSATTILDFNGADYVTVDGRVGGAGAKDLVVSNSNTGGSTIKFINDAIYNTIKYCKVKGVETSTSNGVILFSTSTGASGNDNNTIDNCDLFDGATTPTNIIYSAGTAAKTNDNVVISGNNIYNFFNPNNSASGVKIASNSSDWTVSGNSFYQTATRTFTTGFSQYTIYLGGGNNYLVQNNFIGGTGANAGGTPWTINGAVSTEFYGIYLIPNSCSIQGNTISNFDFTTTSNVFAWQGIYVNGNADIGTVTGNIIGSGTGNNSIITTTSGNGGITSGINLQAFGKTVNCSNNTIGSITALGTSAAVVTSAYGFYFSNGSGTFSNNIIGSTTTANSIINNAANAASANNVIGIFHGASGFSTFSGNTIANLTNAYTSTSAGKVGGIISTSTNSISGNTIYNLTCAAPQTNSGASSSVIGISQVSSVAGQTISQNTVYGLINTAATANNVNVLGINYAGPTAGVNVVSRNFVHSLSAESTGTGSNLIGINITAGVTDFVNNMIRMGVKSDGSSVNNNFILTGISLANASQTNLYYNSVFIGGNVTAAGNPNTFAFNKSITATGNHSIQNNIFINTRTNGAGTGKHYSISSNDNTLTVCDYNLLYMNATSGGLFGQYGGVDKSTISSWRTASGFDSNSKFGNAPFVNPNGDASVVNLHINPAIGSFVESSGTIVGTYTTDYDADPRYGGGGYAGSGTAPDIGADEGEFTLLTDLFWVGGAGSWNDAAHWAPSSGGPGGAGIPDININVYIDDNSGTGPANPVIIPGPYDWFTKGFNMSGVNGGRTPVIGSGSLLPRP